MKIQMIAVGLYLYDAEERVSALTGNNLGGSMSPILLLPCRPALIKLPGNTCKDHQQISKCYIEISLSRSAHGHHFHCHQKGKIGNNGGARKERLS